MYFFSNILVTLFATSYLESPCLFNQCKTTVQSLHTVIDIILQLFNPAFTFFTKLEAMCAETLSSLGMVRFFLEIRDLLTTNPLFLTDG